MECCVQTGTSSRWQEGKEREMSEAANLFGEEHVRR
jgi:hypothetical protein